MGRLLRSLGRPVVDGSSDYLQRRLRQGVEPAAVALRRRRRIAACLACLVGAVTFFGLYVLSWALVLDM